MLGFQTGWTDGPTPLRVETLADRVLATAGPTHDKVTLIVSVFFTYISAERIAYNVRPTESSASAVAAVSRIAALLLFSYIGFACIRAIANAFLRRETLEVTQESTTIVKHGILRTTSHVIRTADILEISDSNLAIGFRTSAGYNDFGWRLTEESVLEVFGAGPDPLS